MYGERLNEEESAGKYCRASLMNVELVTNRELGNIFSWI